MNDILMEVKNKCRTVSYRMTAVEGAVSKVQKRQIEDFEGTESILNIVQCIGDRQKERGEAMTKLQQDYLGRLVPN